MSNLKHALGLKDQQSPFPWQEELLEGFLSGISNRMSLDIPTGLGKTSVMAAWLVARSQDASIPRRLVYVVDRRAVVDQASREAERLRKWVDTQPELKKRLKLGADGQLPISTLRGQFADNRQWLSDPAAPAIIVGTVDMVGSRLLFEGYGVSRKMRPYHAGFLGADTLFVLDEAHLVPPFEKLLEHVTAEQTELRGIPEAEVHLPRSVLLSLSATGRHCGGHERTITDKDLHHPIADRRLRATKRLRLIESDDDSKLVDRLASEAWELSEEDSAPKRVIVYCNTRTMAREVYHAIKDSAKANKKQQRPKREIATELFVGARRVRERQGVADWLERHGFLAGTTSSLDKPAFVISTSAGEVGVDLDADHMVCDLVALERMIQRFGRVNRRGDGNAEIRVLLERDKPNKTESADLKKSLSKPERQRNAKDHELVRQFDEAPKYRAALEALPPIDDGQFRNASPEALRQLKICANNNEVLAQILTDATTPAPLRPELTRPILDSWSMTSLENHSARPFVAPWLRGWVEDKPETTVVWRRYLPTMSNQSTDRQIEKQIKDFFEAAPIHLTEKLETSSDDIFKWLLKRVERIVKLKSASKRKDVGDLAELPRHDDIVAIVIDHNADLVRRLSLRELEFKGGREVQNRKRQLSRELKNHTLIVDARLGGLAEGLLDDKASELEPAIAADDNSTDPWILSANLETDDVDPIPAFRVLDQSAEELAESEQLPPDRQWKTCYRMPIQAADEDEASRFLTVQKFRRSVTSEESRSTTGERRLEDHLNDTENEAERLAKRLKLPAELCLVLKIAARNHDHGKNCDRWQNAFSAPEVGRPYAKTSGPFRPSYLEGYRHEFASLPFVEKDSDFTSLSADLKDLTVHLVAAHHGFARPVIRTDACPDAPSVLRDRACGVALRFARLQKQWGPWGLAWLESLLRAADHRASAIADDQSRTSTRRVQKKPKEVSRV